MNKKIFLKTTFTTVSKPTSKLINELATHYVHVCELQQEPR